MKVRIKDIGKIVTGKTPSTTNPTNFGEGYLFITPVDLHIDSGIIKHSQRTITEEGFRSIQSNTISGLSILVGCIGWDMGNVALVDQKCATNQQINAITDINKDICNPYYLYYWFKLQKKYLFKIANVTRTPILKKSDFENIEINLPNIAVQNSIAKFCRNIDLKISINNTIFKELESMNKTIYDYWFLQFEFPDKDGKPYKSNGGKMVWNDQLKQEIPKGWKVKKLQDLAQFGNGINYSKDINGDKSYKIVNVRDITSSSLVINDHDLTKIAIPNKNINKYFVNKNDILIARSGTPGAVRILTSTKEKILFAGFIIHCLPNDPALRWYLTYSLKELEGTNATTTGGSILQNVSQTTLKSILIILPPDSLIEKFNQQLTSIVKCLQNNIKENQQLKSLRDFLLPLLMNGQVTIED